MSDLKKLTRAIRKSKPTKTDQNIKANLDISELLGKNDGLDKLNYLLALKYLKVRRNILKAIIKKTQGGKLTGLKIGKDIKISELLGEPPKLSLLSGLRWLKVKNQVLKKVGVAAKNANFEFGKEIDINDILGSSPEQDFITKTRFFLIRQKLLSKISKAAKSFDADSMLNGMLGIESASADIRGIDAANNIEGTSSGLSTDESLDELRGIHTGIDNIYDHLKETNDVSDDTENLREQIARNERRHKELLAATRGGSSFIGRGGSGDKEGGGLLDAGAGLAGDALIAKALTKGKGGKIAGLGKKALTIGGGIAAAGLTFGKGLLPKRLFSNKPPVPTPSTTVSKEVTEKAAKEATEKVSKETTEKVTKEATEKVAKQATGTVGKQVAKATAKATTKGLIKKIPIIGAIAGLGFGVSRALKGDFVGAGMEVSSGLASVIPGGGTAASIGIDATLLARDVAKIKKEESDSVIPTETITGKKPKTLDVSDEARNIFDQIGAVSKSAGKKLEAGEEISPKLRTNILLGLAKSDTALSAKLAQEQLNAMTDSVQAGVSSQKELDALIKKALVSATRKSGLTSESDLKGIESLYSDERIGQLNDMSSENAVPTETMTGKKPESLDSAFAYAESAEGLMDPTGAANRVAGAADRKAESASNISPTETVTGQKTAPKPEAEVVKQGYGMIGGQFTAVLDGVPYQYGEKIIQKTENGKIVTDKLCYVKRGVNNLDDNPENHRVDKESYTKFVEKMDSTDWTSSAKLSEEEIRNLKLAPAVKQPPVNDTRPSITAAAAATVPTLKPVKEEPFTEAEQNLIANNPFLPQPTAEVKQPTVEDTKGILGVGNKPKPETIKEFEARIRQGILSVDAAETTQIQAGSQQYKMDSAARIADRQNNLTNTAQPLRGRGQVRARQKTSGLSGFASKAFGAIAGQGFKGRIRRVMSSRDPIGESKKLFDRTKNRYEGFGELSPLQQGARILNAPSPTNGSQLTATQNQNKELLSQQVSNGVTPISAPTTVNNNQSSNTVTNSVMSLPHLDKTRESFGKTNLAW